MSEAPQLDLVAAARDPPAFRRYWKPAGACPRCGAPAFTDDIARWCFDRCGWETRTEEA